VSPNAWRSVFLYAAVMVVLGFSAYFIYDAVAALTTPRVVCSQSPDRDQPGARQGIGTVVVCRNQP
jgi:hypothetical protein